LRCLFDRFFVLQRPRILIVSSELEKTRWGQLPKMCSLSRQQMICILFWKKDDDVLNYEHSIFKEKLFKSVLLTSWIPANSCVLYEHGEKLKNHSLLRSVMVNQLYTRDLVCCIWTILYTSCVFISCLSIRKIEKKSFRSACLQPEDSGIQEVKALSAHYAVFSLLFYGSFQIYFYFSFLLL